MIRTADGLTVQQQHFMEYRYVEVLKEFKARCQFYAGLFHTFRTVITVGSLLVPALLSVQYSSKQDSQPGQTASTYQIEIYWITWVVSLLVTMSNGVQALLKVDKKYFYLHTTYEQLISEGWQYLQLTGRYAGQLNNTRPSYRNQFILFAHFIEKIKMRQVEEEYYKALESHHSGTTAATAQVAGRQDDSAPAVSTPPELKGQSTTISIPMVAVPPTNATFETNALFPAPPSPSTAVQSFVDSFLEPAGTGK